MTSTAESTDLNAVLATLRENAVALAQSGTQPPSRIRVEAAGVVVELGWASAEAAAPVVAPEPVAPTPVPVPTNGTAPTPGHRLTAPTVGVFYRSPEPGAPPFVAVGDHVQPGQQVGIVEAMKLMIPVEADRGGPVLELLCGDGESVEFGQPLMVLG
ncbi:MAG: acetyl-CoA carboxylase biotin carboxyl carrier protein subunit [Pseudonocardia sp.]|nr:acetyl-CoA carboxylase biotin carboxyl carrier protein subunit [Pseudonocardia sp.]